jgi:hypothetical protein
MTASGKPLNYTTAIPATQTAGECQAILAMAGAASVSVRYEDGQPSGLAFTLKTPHGERAFTLPVNIDGVQRVLAQAERDGLFATARKRAGTYSSREHATRVAWRVAKDWLEAVLALIAAKMAPIDEVMLGYLVVNDSGKTLYQSYREREQAALEAGSP